MNLEVLKTINRTNIFNLKLGIHKMTNSEWEDVFNVLKINTTYIENKKIKYLTRNCNMYVMNTRWKLSGDNSIDTTQDMYYCNYINDVLRNIREGNIDYCYYVYQVIELLRFEKNLKSRLVHYDDGLDYIRVWLDR